MPPERRHRWTVVLDCGCTTVALTQGAEHSPDDGSSHRLFRGGLVPASQHAFVIDRSFSRPPGCRCADHGLQPVPVRDVREWVKRWTEYSPRDPVVPPEWWGDDDPDTWERVRSKHGHDFAAWTVLLECGHFARAHSDIDSRPEAWQCYDCIWSRQVVSWHRPGR